MPSVRAPGANGTTKVIRRDGYSPADAIADSVGSAASVAAKRKIWRRGYSIGALPTPTLSQGQHLRKKLRPKIKILFGFGDVAPQDRFVHPGATELCHCHPTRCGNSERTLSRSTA